MNEETLPRLVRVPLAGYIDVEIDNTIEVATSRGWGDQTEFEEAAVAAASDALVKFFDAAREAKVPDVSQYEWTIDAYAKIVSGNILHVECNEVEDLGVD